MLDMVVSNGVNFSLRFMDLNLRENEDGTVDISIPVQSITLPNGSTIVPNSEEGERLINEFTSEIREQFSEIITSSLNEEAPQ